MGTVKLLSLTNINKENIGMRDVSFGPFPICASGRG